MESKTFKFNDKTYQEYKAKFAELDKNKQGFVNLGDLSETNIDIFKRIDINHTGKVTLDEFICFYESELREVIERQFKQYDRDGDGLITVEEVDDFFGEGYFRAESMWLHMDKNNDGKVTFDDFAKIYFKIN